MDLLADPDISFNGNLPKVPPETFMNLVEMLVDVQSLYRETGGVHTSAEDIGRHNTPDKIAGLCLMNNA